MSAPSGSRRAVAGLLLVLASLLGAAVAAAEVTDVVPAVGGASPVAAEPGSLGGAELEELEDVDDDAALRAGAGAAVCPAVGDGEEPARLLVAVAGSSGSAEFSLIHYRDGEAHAQPTQTLEASEPVQVDLDPEEASEPVAVRWRGDPVVAAWRVGTRPAAAGTCEPHPSPVWHVPGFDTTLGSSSTLHLVNPYTSDAVVRVTFATPEGRSALMRTDNVLIGAGEHRELDLNDLEPEHPELAATVEVLAGRVFTQGEVEIGPSQEGEGRSGRALLPPATGPARGVVAAGGAGGTRADRWLVVQNLGDREEGFRLAVSDPVEDAPELLSETGVPPGGVVRVQTDELSESDDFGLALEPVGDAQLVATQITSAASEAGGEDAAAELLQSPDRSWTFAGARGDRGTLAVYNPGTESATVDVDAGEGAPGEWQRVSVGAGQRATLALGEVGVDAPVPLLVDADQPVAASLTVQREGEDMALYTLPPVTTEVWQPLQQPPVRRDPGLPGRLDHGAPDDVDELQELSRREGAHPPG